MLIIICQILILTLCALALAQPNQVLKAQIDYEEVVVVIDSSASMRAGTVNDTRFDRAAYRTLDEFDKLSENGVMSVIVADENPYYLLTGISRENRATIKQALDDLISNDRCSYGSSDINAAMVLCEEALEENPDIQIILFTDVEYSYIPKNIRVENVIIEGEWNAAILNAYAELENNYFVFYVDVACYGRSPELVLNLQVQDANAYYSSSGETINPGETISYDASINFLPDTTHTIIFKYFLEGEEVQPLPENMSYHFIENYGIFSFRSIHISFVDVQDSFYEDNSFEIYGGQKEVLSIQYASGDPNPFISSFLYVLQKAYQDRWDVQINQVRKGEEPEIFGYDFYIYEHFMPNIVPEDGVVLLINLDKAPLGADFQVTSQRHFNGQSMSLSEFDQHPITSNINADNITVSLYRVLANLDPSYKVLMTVDNDPVLILRDEPDSKIAVLSFSLHFSNLPIRNEFSLLLYRMFEHFLPPTVVGNAFEVHDNIELRARSSELSVIYDDTTIEEFRSFPAVLNTVIPGTYKLEQQTFFGKFVSERIYVKIPAVESNILLVQDGLPNPYNEIKATDYFRDLLIFIMAMIVALLLLERLLRSREEI